LYNQNEINQVLESDFKPDIIQLPMNILDTRLYRCGILGQLAKEGIEVHARSAFLQGLFYLPEFELKNRFSDAVPYLEKLKSIAEVAGLTLSELSLLWLMSLEEVCKVVIGVDSASQLEVHLQTIKKNVDTNAIKDALSVHFENNKILNPSNW
jgi:aryl-alcohol dehydrogenase-like predicted oxidoreductase